ncbi:Fluoroacetate dehalogenase [Lachnellula occidentalis]|uniref:Fluoroacetate dehalogenase n=1 Tax=Lachnellula occidentalis TaxID=215460 RepID=A0A8H8S722_9HELO|nr:Fluoroacetate dehalogenase [Lachnellula occidentalis]
MFEGFEEFNIAVTPDVTIHGIKCGTGPPLLLLHGFPQTHHIWHKITPSLTPSLTVIALDLRGYGRSSKPPSSAQQNHAPYSKSVMASDCVTVMSSLGFKKFSICSHDRGARVAHKLCVDAPESVERVMFLDIAPTLAMFEKTDMQFATAYWHWFFLIQPSPFPETLLMTVFWRRVWGKSEKKEIWDEQALAEYMRQFEDREGVHAMCEDYRAAATIDLEEARKDQGEGRKIMCPVRVLVGAKGVVAMKFDFLKEWRDVSEGMVTGEPVDSGHYIAEENPDVLLKHIKGFLGDPERVRL